MSGRDHYEVLGVSRSAGTQRARYDAMSRPVRDRTLPWPITRWPQDAPRFVDEDHEVPSDDLIGALLREVLQPGWATPAWARSRPR